MELELTFERPRSEDRVKGLLAACHLPYADLTPSHLEHFVAAWDGSRLAGVVGLELLGDVALLRSLAVPAEYRGRGIGSQLTRQAEAYARSCGVEGLYLLTTTAEAFFARRGYRVVGRDVAPAAVRETTEFRSLCPDSAVCMVKYLFG